MIHKRLEEISKADIDALVSYEVSEGRSLEYKSSLPGSTRDERKEFLADVSSFANGGGGDLVYGVQERRDENGKNMGIPASALGLADLNADQEVLRLEGMLRDGLDPRLPIMNTKVINGFQDGPVLLIRVGQSWNAPHMNKADWRFYARTSAGKYPLDTSEIRSAFDLAGSMGERLRRWRDGRLAKITAGETPSRLGDGAKIVLHMVPLAWESNTHSGDVERFLANSQNRIGIRPMGHGLGQLRFNIDGFLSFVSDDSKPTYTQVFRMGAVEFVGSNYARNIDGVMVLPSQKIEVVLIESFDQGLDILATADITPPFVVMISLVGVKAHRLAVRSWLSRGFDEYLIDRDVLLLPDLLIEEHSGTSVQVLRPAFDALWQAAGWPKCADFDEQDHWIKDPFG